MHSKQLDGTRRFPADFSWRDEIPRENCSRWNSRIGRNLTVLGRALAGIFIIAVTLVSGRAADLMRLDWDTGLDGQPGWLKYIGNDAPAGGFFATMGPKVSSVTGTISDVSVPAGTYRVWVKGIDYDVHGRLAVEVGGSVVSTLTDDRNPDKYWTSVGIINVASTATSIRLTYTKPVSSTPLQRFMFRGIYLTPEITGSITSDDFFGVFRVPSSTEVDDSAAVKGNLIPNSSFEVGMGGGWGLNTIGRDFSLESIHWKNDAWDGRSCVRIEVLKTESPPILLSKPIRLKANKKYTVSAYVKSSELCNVSLKLICVSGVPSTITPRMLKGGGTVAGNEWTRISTSDIATGYPDAEYEVQVVARPYLAVHTDLLIDAVQLEEGDLSEYQSMAPLEVGMDTATLGNVLISGSLPYSVLRVYNSSSERLFETVHVEVFNNFNQKVDSFEYPVIAYPKTPMAYTVRWTDLPQGAFRVNSWVESPRYYEDEHCLSIIAPAVLGDGKHPESALGVSADFSHWQLTLMQKLGFKWLRAMSPAGYFRWGVAEPVEGAFVYYDEEVARPRQHNFSIMGGLAGPPPVWAQRTYFKLDDLTGPGFRVGERVVGPRGSGTVTVALTSANPTGLALQVKPRTGLFNKGDRIVGSSSGSRAEVSSLAYSQSLALDRWENYVRQVTRRYKGDVAAWEIWNEPNQGTSATPEPDGDKGFYAEMLRRASLVIQQEDPAAKIVGLGGIFQWQWATNVLSKLSPNVTDAVSVHYYPDNGGLSVSFKTNVLDVYNQEGWNTEAGLSCYGYYSGVSAVERNKGQPLIPYRDGERYYRAFLAMPERIARNYVQSIGGGLSKWFYYDARSAANPSLFAPHFTMIDYDDSVKPKGVAVSFVGNLFSRAIGHGKVALQSPQSECFLIETGGGYVYANLVSVDHAKRRIDLPSIGAGKITVFDLMGNIVPQSGASIQYGRSIVYAQISGTPWETLKEALENATITTLPDKTPPNLSILLGPRGVSDSASGDVRFRWIGIDDVSLPEESQPESMQYSYRLLPRSNWSAWSTAINVNFGQLPPGSYTFSVQARDEAGNTAAPVSRNFRLD